MRPSRRSSHDINNSRPYKAVRQGTNTVLLCHHTTAASDLPFLKIVNTIQ